MSSKKNNNDGEDNKDKKLFDRIRDRQGFYTILILCIVIITATALWVDNQKDDHFISENPTNPFGDDAQPEVTLVEDDKEDADKSQETGKIGEGKPADSKTMDSKKKPQEKGNENITEKDSKTKKIEKSSIEKYNEIEETMSTLDPEDMEEALITETMEIPVMGKLTLPFADDHLVYHKTLNQWSTHKGIDIQAAEGAPVRAALDGEVVEVINDTIMGITVVIRHDSELSTVYSNLSTDAMVEIGEQVKKGQTISGVGKTASNKTSEGPLLHFQVLRGDKFVNPELYLGKISES